MGRVICLTFIVFLQLPFLPLPPSSSILLLSFPSSSFTSPLFFFLRVKAIDQADQLVLCWHLLLGVNTNGGGRVWHCVIDMCFECPAVSTYLCSKPQRLLQSCFCRWVLSVWWLVFICFWGADSYLVLVRGGGVVYEMLTGSVGGPQLG